MTTSEACTLLADMTQQCAVTAAERDLAIAERDTDRLWLRASLRTLVAQTRELDRLRADLRRERQQHADLRESIFERSEAA